MTIRLLIAESDPTSARMLEASLVRYGFEVTHAPDGEAAAERFSARAFDVVLLDVSLPRKNGLEAAKAIRTKPGGNQVGLVLMSGSTVSPDIVLELKRAQVDAWFNKPLSLRDLRDRLAELAYKYTGATSALLPIENGRRTLAKAKQRAPAKNESPGAPPPATKASATSAPVPRPVAASSTTRTASVVASPASAAQVSATVSPSAGVSAPPAPFVASSPSPSAARTTGLTESSRSSIERAPVPKEPSLSATPRPLDDAHASARMLLRLARERATGVYLLSHKGAEAKVAFLEGVMVGAMDSSIDNRLLTRLSRRGAFEMDAVDEILTYARDHKLRAAEAVLALEYCDAETLLDELERQANARLVVAAAWPAGEMRFLDDKAEVERLAISRFDAYEVLFQRFDQLSDPVMVRSWLERSAASEISTSRDFEDGLVAYARVAPTSPLPGILFAAPPSLRAVISHVDERAAPEDRERFYAHVYGMWVAGLLRLPDDGPADERPVPRPLRSEQVARAVPDKEACALVRAEWLRAQGRSYYDVLGVARDADEASLREALAAYRERFGEETLGKRQIEPVRGLAEELWALLEDIEITLFDEDQRQFYDSTLAEQEREDASPVERHIDADAAFLEGKLALSRGDQRGAREAFARAAADAPENVEYASYLAWTELLEGAALVESALAALQAAAASEPNEMRSALLVGLAYERIGRLEEARAALEEAERRAPGNPEVEAALRRLRA